MTFGTETKTGRGGFLTAMTFLLVLAGSVDLLKAFTKPAPPGQKMMGMNAPATGIMFLGVLHTGPSATILGVLLAAILFFYAIGIWRMNSWRGFFLTQIHDPISRVSGRKVRPGRVRTGTPIHSASDEVVWAP